MTTRQEMIDRHTQADEARKRLKSGERSAPARNYRTRQEQIDAYLAEHPEAKPKPDTSRFSDIPAFKPEPIAPLAPRAPHDYTGAIPDRSASARSAFTPAPPDKRLLPSNNTVRAFGPAPKNPIVAGYDQLVHGMQSAVNFQQQPTREVPSTGSKGLDSFLRGTGSFLPGLASGQTEGQLAGAGSKAVKAVAQRFAPKAASAVERSGTASFTAKVAGHALDAGVENARIGAAAGQTDTRQVADNFKVGAELGAAGGAAMPLLSKAARAVVDRFKPKAPEPFKIDPATPALPMGRPRPQGNANGAQTPAVITPDYQFKLPLGDEYGLANKAAAAEDLKTVKNEIAHLNGRYEAAVTAEYKYLQNTAKQGVVQGKIHFDVNDVTGDKVVGRTGRQSKNEPWYRDFYAEHGRAPSKKEMLTLARQRVENGFKIDETGNMAPSWLDENDFHNTMEALTTVRDQLTKSLNQAESGLRVTDAQLGGSELSFGKRVAADTLRPKQELPKKPKAEQPKAKQELPKRPKAEPKRANFETMAEAEGISPELKAEIAKLDDRYQPITNAETVAAADKNISRRGVDKATTTFLSRQSTSAEHIAEGYRLMQVMDARGDHETAAAVAAKVAADLTKAGQQAQAGRIIKRLSPEGQILALARKAEDAGMKVTPEDAKDFAKAAKDYAATASAETRTNAMQDVLDKLEAGKAPTEEDIRILQSNIKRAKKFLPDEQPKTRKQAQEQAKPKTKRDRVLDTMQAAEDAAWERIRKRRNVGILPGKGNEAVDYAIIAANRIARGTIKASNHVEQLVQLFGEEVRPLATKIYERGLKHVARHPELKTIKKNVATAEELVDQWAKKTPTTRADLAKVRSLAKAVGSLEGKKAKAADVQMQQIMNKYEKASITDKAQALRFMAMLGNTATQTLNASSNVAMSALKNTTDVLGGMIDIAISKALKQPRTTTAFGMNPFRFTAEMFKNMGAGAAANWKGVNPAGLHSVSELHGLAFKSKANPLHWAERSLRAVAGGADYGVYKAQFDNEILKQARLAAKMVPKADRAKFIRDFKANPPSEALETADNIGKETTFQQGNSLGDLAAGGLTRLGNIKGKGRIPGKALEQFGRAIVPFVRTPLNILETGVSLTPGGLIRGTVELIMAKTPSARRAAITHLGLGVTGTGMGAAGYYLHSIGVITDANDSGNKNLDEVRTESGRGAYRFNQSGMLRYLNAMFAGEGFKAAEEAAAYQEGDRTFNYNKLQPIAFPVALGAGFKEGGVSGGLTQGVGSLLAMSSLKSIQDVVSTGYSGSQGEKQLGVVNRIVESYLKSFSPSLLAQEARREDTTQRQTSFNKGLKADLGDYYKSRVPSLGGLIPEEFTSKSLPAKVTPLGQTKKGMSGGLGNYLNPYQSDVQQYSQAAKVIADLIDRTGDDSIAPSAPSKKIKDVTIPPKRYEQYQRDIGEEITRKILDLSTELTDDQRLKRIAQIMTDTKDKYRTALKHELGIKG